MRFLGSVKIFLFFVVISSSFAIAMKQNDYKTYKSHSVIEREKKLFRSILDAVNKDDASLLESILSKRHISINLNYVLNSFTPQGLTPLHMAIISTRDSRILELLLNSGANPNIGILNDFNSRAKKRNITLFKGWTAAHIATRYKSLPILNLLLKHNTDFFIRDYSGWTPWQVAQNDRRSRDLEIFFRVAQKPSESPQSSVVEPFLKPIEIPEENEIELDLQTQSEENIFEKPERKVEELIETASCEYFRPVLLSGLCFLGYYLLCM